MMAAFQIPFILGDDRKELFYAASELILTLPFAVRRMLDEFEPDGELARRRERLPDLAALPPLRARAVLSIGAIVALLHDELLPARHQDRVLSFTEDDDIVWDGGTALVWPAAKSAEHITEIACIPTNAALIVWSAFIHLLTAHWPHDTFFGYRVERTAGGGVRLRCAV